MRQLVTGLFETYDDARRAQDALLLNGFAATDIELPVPGSAGAATSAGVTHSGNGLLAGLERFLSSLFASRPAPDKPSASPDHDARAASLQFALQRGAVLIGVRVLDDARGKLARDTLIQQQALQVDEHAPDWRPEPMITEAPREHSALDELGIGELTGALRPHAGRRPVTTAPGDETLRARYDELSDAAPPVDLPPAGPADDPAVTALTPAGAPGVAANVEAASPVPDEFLEYEEDFRGHHAARYPASNDDAPFERYQDAYRYGTVLAQDVGNQGRAWSEIEPEARRGWETRVSGVAAYPTWEQVHDAVRHGWERATAQGGGAS